MIHGSHVHIYCTVRFLSQELISTWTAPLRDQSKVSKDDSCTIQHPLWPESNPIYSKMLLFADTTNYLKKTNVPTRKEVCTILLTYQRRQSLRPPIPRTPALQNGEEHVNITDSQPATRSPSPSTAPNGFRPILKGELFGVHDISILEERVEIELLQMLVAVEVPEGHVEGARYLSLPISLGCPLHGPTRAQGSCRCRPCATRSAPD